MRNPAVKFPALLSLADRIGARYVATGHYARRGTGADGRALLRKGRSANDQSYMLAVFPRRSEPGRCFPRANWKRLRYGRWL